MLMNQSSQKRIDRLRSIALESVLGLAGAEPDRHDRQKWHTSQGVLSVTGSKFMNWTRGVGGGGAIDLLIHLHNCQFREALQWLERHFADAALCVDPHPAARTCLRLPTPAPDKLCQVREYLLLQRRLPARLLVPLLESGLIYADAKANAVFLLLDENTHPAGAELRGTTHRCWRGMAPGSQKDLGCFSIGPVSGSAIILCESAIDALSCRALHPHYRCLSTAGARPSPRWLSSIINQGCQIYCGFDADPTGDAMAQAMLQLHPSIQRLRPSKKDWNDLLKSRG
jgi:hypothetical protein